MLSSSYVTPIWRTNDMNILILFTSSKIGGAERSLTRMALANKAEDVVYHLATLGGEGGWVDWVNLQSSQVAILGDITRWSFLSTLRAFYSVVLYISEKKIDIIYLVGLKAAILARLLKPVFPKVLMVNAIRASLSPSTPEGKNYRHTERFFKYLTTHYISNSRAGCDAVTRFGVSADRVSLIYNGLDIETRPILPMHCRPMEICLIANISSRKGHEPFLDVIEIICKSLPEVLFRFIGRDDMNGSLQEHVARRGLERWICFEGFQSKPANYLRRSRVSVLPAILPEGAPTSILEAFACGTPVICYDNGGSSELVRHGIDGYLIRNGDQATFARHLIEILENSEKAQQMGLAGLEKVRQSFAINVCAENHATLWRRLKSKVGH
jgi:glycosyltransferase involved in cell wall biosynthesis